MIVILLVLILNALLTMFKDDYYTTFGNYRLFSIVSDSMEDTIPKGSMIVDKKPKSEADIKVGTIITFKTKNGKETVLLTHRVVAIGTDSDGKTVYTTKGDNANGNDSFKPHFSDVVGVYIGKKCGFFGSFFGFIQSSIGVSVLILALFIIVVAWLFVWYVDYSDRKKKLQTAALKKSAEALSEVNLRYDNVCAITAVMDVLDMVTDESEKRADEKAKEERLNEFLKAESFELPKTPETAAMLDSMPAPDTPGALAAALSTGASLRQAEDGQTLVLTTLSGDKNILLTPVQTADGIILCRQGVRLRSDLAPNIEDVGVTSMPASPEFFEGKPLEKNVEYPELPQPAKALGPEALLGAGAQAPDKDRQLLASGDNSHSAYAKYREYSAQLELRQAEQLSDLLAGTAPLTPEEQVKVAEYKAAHKKQPKPKKPRTEEQKAKAKAAAERKLAEQEELLNSLSPSDRELYLTEQKLAKSRSAAIRKLKRIESDRKILERIEE